MERMTLLQGSWLNLHGAPEFRSRGKCEEFDLVCQGDSLEIRMRPVLPFTLALRRDDIGSVERQASWVHAHGRRDCGLRRKKLNKCAAFAESWSWETGVESHKRTSKPWLRSSFTAVRMMLDIT